MSLYIYIYYVFTTFRDSHHASNSISFSDRTVEINVHKHQEEEEEECITFTCNVCSS